MTLNAIETNLIDLQIGPVEGENTIYNGAEPEGNRKSPGFALVRILLECPTARPRGTTIPALVNPAMAHARQLNTNFEIGLLD